MGAESMMKPGLTFRTEFDDDEIAGLLFTIGLIAFWNTVNVAVEFPGCGALADREIAPATCRKASTERTRMTHTGTEPENDA